MAFDPAEFKNQLDALQASGTSLKTLNETLAKLSAQNIADLRALTEEGGKLQKAIDGEVAGRSLLATSLQNQRAQQESLLSVASDQLVIDQREIELNKIKIEQLNEQIRQRPELITQLHSEIEAIKERNIEMKESVAEQRVARKGADDLLGSFQALLSGRRPSAKSLLNITNIKSLTTNFTKMGGAAGVSKMALTKLGPLMVGAAVLSFVRAIAKLAIQMHDLEAGFMKATGANEQFARSVTRSYEATRGYGVTAAEASAATQALYTGFTDFTFASTSQRESLIKTSSILGRMGISHGDFAKSIQISTKALGMSTEAANQNMLNLAKMGEQLGVTPQQMAQDFAGAGDMMAKMGDQGVGAFKDLAVAAKVTGMKMQDILRITDKFDTFEGAAEMAGKLNAAIGGNMVNAMDLMMTTDPAERFGMIRDAILDTGLTFDDMSYYQKKFYAESMGLKDVSELALVLSGNMDLVDGATQQSSQSIEEAARRAASLASFQEKLNMLFVKFIPIIEPLIDIMSNFLDIVLKLTDALFKDDVGASTFYQGIGKLVHSFASLAEVMAIVSSPIKTISTKVTNGGGGAGAAAGVVGLQYGGIVTKPTLAMVGEGGPEAVIPLGRGGAAQTTRQPISIELNGEKLANFMVEVIGTHVKEINLV